MSSCTFNLQPGGPGVTVWLLSTNCFAYVTFSAVYVPGAYFPELQKGHAAPVFKHIINAQRRSGGESECNLNFSTRGKLSGSQETSNLLFPLAEDEISQFYYIRSKNVILGYYRVQTYNNYNEYNCKKYFVTELKLL
jgi:hypothetical protein